MTAFSFHFGYYTRSTQKKLFHENASLFSLLLSYGILAILSYHMDSLEFTPKKNHLLYLRNESQWYFYNKTRTD